VIDPIVRPAVPGDAVELRRLEHDARRALQGVRGADRWLQTNPAVDREWEDHIAARRVFVAVIDDVVVGYIRTAADGDVARVDDVFVVDAARELGFGDALLAASLEQARTGGATWFEGHALPGDRATKNLYERAGIKARLITVSVELGEA
jgi:GNAT superfamily N-acetyltransferase